MFLRLFNAIKCTNQLPKQLYYTYINRMYLSISAARSTESDEILFGNLNAPLEKRSHKKKHKKPPKHQENLSTQNSEQSDPKVSLLTRDGSSTAKRNMFGTLRRTLEMQHFSKRNRNIPEGMGKLNTRTFTPTSTKSKPTEHDSLEQTDEERGEPDVFGKLAGKELAFQIQTTEEREIPEEVDILSSQSVKPMDIKRKRFIDYAKDIRKLSSEKKLKEALELFESLPEIGVRYENDRFLYCVMISACAKQGYTKKAFGIYAKMRQHGLKPSAGVLTGLFNACAECPFPEYGLEKAQTLHRKMKEEGWLPSQVTYHAMIKAYGRCKDLASAFALADEMKQGGYAITDETFSFLLQACISDKDAGFTHSISIMRKMHAMKIKPSLYNYNLLLRAVRDCGVGPPEVSSKLLLDWSNQRDWLNRPNTKLLPAPSADLDFPSSTKDLDQDFRKLEHHLMTTRKPNISSNATDLPETNTCMTHLNSSEASRGKVLKLEEVSLDLLAPRPQGSEIMALGKVNNSADRLALVGGPQRIITKLLNLGHKPDIKTFTLLLESQESCETTESLLLRLMIEAEVKPDIDFLNVLIKKRCSRMDYASAKNVLQLIAEFKLSPDVATFGTLAMTCKKRYLSQTFCKDLVSVGCKPNIKIAGALMKNAYLEMDFYWMLDLMDLLSEHGVSPCPVFLNQLEEAWKDAAQALVQIERGKDNVPMWAEREDFGEQYKHFCLRYKKWLKSVEVDVAKHPWDQFRSDRKTPQKLL